MREDVEKWDVHIIRQWPYGGMRLFDPVPPVLVKVAVDFTNEASALEFEAQVRELLKGAS